MKKWVLLTVFLVATSLVSIAMNMRTPPADLRGQRAVQLAAEQKYDQAAALFEQLAAENKDNPTILANLQYNIAFCRAHMAPQVTAPISGPTTTAPAATQASAAQIIDPATGSPRAPHEKPKAGTTLTITIKELGNFTFDPVQDATVPADVLALNGCKVTLRGFIIPFEEADSITEFALQPSLNGCCFGQPAGVQHTIICHAAAERKVQFVPTEVLVTGKLMVKPERENDYTHTIFQLNVETVAPAK